jgi:hypothetical protein
MTAHDRPQPDRPQPEQPQPEPAQPERPVPPRPDHVRPLDGSPIHTVELPDTPQRDRTIPATAWIEAPAELLSLGDDIGEPPSRGDARYLAIAADDLALQYRFRLHPDGSGEGAGPSGTVHGRFRTWKEDLRDASIAAGFPMGGDSP